MFDMKKLLATFGMPTPYKTTDVPGLFQERIIVLDGALAGGAATSGQILDDDVTDANRETGVLRVDTPYRAVVSGLAIVIPGASVADLETLAGALAIRFAVQGATYTLPAAPYIQVPAGSDGAASPEPQSYQPVRCIPLDMPVAFEGVTSDRIQLVADIAETIPAVAALQVYCKAALVDSSVQGGREAIKRAEQPVGEPCGCDK